MKQMHDILINELKNRYPDVEFKENKAVKDFSWKNNFGSDSCWLALYPQDKEDHKEAAQLNLFISGERIEYGLNLGENLQNTLNHYEPKLEVVAPTNNLNLDDILQKYENIFDEYLRINNGSELLKELAEPFSIIFKDWDKTEQFFNFLNNICKELNINNENDLLYSITFRDYGKRKGIHFSYTNILAIGVYGLKGSEEIRVLLPLFTDRGSEFGDSNQESFKSIGGDKDIKLFYVPYDLLLNRESKLFTIYKETLKYIEKQKQDYSRSPYRVYQDDLLASAIFNPEEREYIFSTGLTEKNYYWITANSRDINFVDVEDDDIVEFQADNITHIIGKIKQGDTLVGYHSDHSISGVWVLLEVQEILREDKIKLKIIDKLSKPLTREEIEDKVSGELVSGETIQKISADVYTTIEEMFIIKKETEDSLLKVNFENELEILSLYFPPAEKKRLIDQIKINLKQGKHIILTGPPGTGKSKLAKVICENYCKDSYSMVTATSDWSTFNTIGGYRPNQEGRLEFDSGVFLSCFKNGSKPDNKWLILDEINRADIDKAFGPLFSALTGDKITLSFKSSDGRNITLRPQGDISEMEPKEHVYIIPNDWRLIATMNTFDKTSLYEMSYAFMRRFAFVPVTIPRVISVDLVEEYLDCWEIEDKGYAKQVSLLWSKINTVRKIGPAIVEDIYKYLLANGDYASPIINYVLPQFEGTREKEINSFVSGLKNELDFISEEDIEIIEDFVKDYFCLGGQTIGY